MLDAARVPSQDRDGVAAVRGDGDAAVAVERLPFRAVRESGLDDPAHRHLAGNAVDPPHQLAIGGQAAERQRHRVGDADGAALRS